jgi:hypothetical protein
MRTRLATNSTPLRIRMTAAARLDFQGFLDTWRDGSRADTPSVSARPVAIEKDCPGRLASEAAMFFYRKKKFMTVEL